MCCVAGSFLDQCAEMREKQELICSVQKLLSIPPTVFIELERTKQVGARVIVPRVLISWLWAIFPGPFFFKFALQELPAVYRL